ncbi:helix-turn-helix domain-containing protein [Pseudomonas sp. W2I6]|uniref:helix-turn-helix domain-containing protein n=1 Tax=Pseudomonas sp. W2I6 TaxID=3042289 RepID=UPI002786CBDF|nr:helix-turn-helix transcriptional regulator [Pseudomonas sp. W2I6]MDQ0668342.1 transcriptional regulator with XRE-family HTH domain [Pseudomonas sp. W2I6]
MIEIGSRLREERTRLEMTQRSFALAGGVLANAQGKYERGKRSPNAIYLARLAGLGVDILYVVTGQRAAPQLSVERIAELNFQEQFAMLSKLESRALLDLMNCLTKKR